MDFHYVNHNFSLFGSLKDVPYIFTPVSIISPYARIHFEAWCKCAWTQAILLSLISVQYTCIKKWVFFFVSTVRKPAGFSISYVFLNLFILLQYHSTFYPILLLDHIFYNYVKSIFIRILFFGCIPLSKKLFSPLEKTQYIWSCLSTQTHCWLSVLD